MELPLIEISLIAIAAYIFYSLKKEKSEGLITLTSFVIAIIAWGSESSEREIFSAGMAFVASLYMLFFGWSLATLKPHFKILSRVNTDILLFFGILLANEYAVEPEVIDSKWVLVIVVSYGLLAAGLNHVGKNDKEGLAATTHTLKKGYLLKIEEIDKEISLLIVSFFTILASLWGWLTQNESFVASSQLFNYQLSVFVLALLMLIFSAVKFSLKRDELTKKENKRVELASRGRYGEYYGCNNTLLWETRRQSIRAALKAEFYPEDNEFDTIFFSEDRFNLSKCYCYGSDSTSKHSENNSLTKCSKNDPIKKWDYYCQLASAYYSHAISLQKLNKKDKDVEIQEYLLKAFYIYKNLPEIEDGFSDEYYHYIDLCNDLYICFLSKDMKAIKKESPIKDKDQWEELVGKFYPESNVYKEKLKQSVNYNFNKILNDLRKNSAFEAAIQDLNNISEGLKDEKQCKAASNHTKTIELLSALNNANNFEKLEDWIGAFNYAKGHINKNIEKFKAQRFDAPANLFITTTGVIISIVAIISILEIFDYSKVVNIEIFALSGGALSMILAFIFKNVIESFFAALQMYLSDMLKIGDRIKCEALSIDGYVSGFGFSSIDFQNLDNSNIKVPARDLIEKTFSNLRTLPENGRRIEIKLTFSANSINVFTPKDVEEIKRNVDDMGPYLDCKLKSMISFNCKSSKKDEDGSEGSACYKEAINVKGDDLPSKRFLSNLGSFRAYAEQYLFEHQWLNDGASPMAVIYDTSAEGVTVLFTAYSQPDDRFVRTKAFLNLESDIVEHLITTSRYFGLKLHQSESEAGVVEKSATYRLLKRRDF